MFRLQDGVCSGSDDAFAQYPVLGDYWSFVVEYQNQDGTDVSMIGQTPSARILYGTVGSVDLSVINSANNEITFGYAGGSDLVSQYPGRLRLQAWLVDSLGHKTSYAFADLFPADPRGDLSKLPSRRTIIGRAGPAGPPPSVHLIQQLIAAGIVEAQTKAQFNAFLALGLF